MGVVLVTGSSRGIGAATARRLAADGHAVGVHCATDTAAAEQLANALRAGGTRAQVLQGDVDRAGFEQALHQEVEVLGDEIVEVRLESDDAIGARTGRQAERGANDVGHRALAVAPGAAWTKVRMLRTQRPSASSAWK